VESVEEHFEAGIGLEEAFDEREIENLLEHGNVIVD
jgi:hypothetical protein